MNADSLRNSPYKILLLWLVPVVTFLVMGSALINTRYVFMYGGDPMYAYLLNGLTLARGEADIGHTDNPGTTVQALSAVIIRSVYLFSDSDNITDDVIANPEKYLFIARIIQLSLISLGLFFLGYKVYKWQNNSLPLALFLQNCVLTGTMTIIHSHSFAPEGFLIVGGIAMVMLCAKVLIDNRNEKNIPARYAILFGIICGFMLITKLPGVVYVFIPLLVLTGIRNKLIFFGSFVASAFMFVLPAINRIHYLFDFALNVATHSGHYGVGEEKMFNTNEFIENLKTHITSDYVLSLLMFAAIATLIGGVIKYKTWFTNNKLWFRMLMGITLSILANLFLATKHFGYHYLIPSQVLLVLVAYILIKLFSKKFSFPSMPQWSNTSLIVIACLILPAALYARYSRVAHYFTDFRQTSIPGNEILFNEKKLPRIYVTTVPATAGPEPSFAFGYYYAGDSRWYYGEFINKHYPNAFLFEPFSNGYQDFGNAVLPECIATRYPEAWFYVYRDTVLGAAQRQVFLALRDSIGPVVTFEKYYTEPNGLEEIYLMKSDTARARKLFPLKRNFVFDFEQMSGDTAFIGSDTLQMTAMLPAVTTKSFSGSHALYFEGGDVFAGHIMIPVVPGAVYEISAWKYGDALSWIVACGGPNNEFYKAGGAATGLYANGWKEIMLRIIIPPDYSYPEVKVFLYNADRNNHEMWIDDLRVKEYQRIFTP